MSNPEQPDAVANHTTQGNSTDIVMEEAQPPPPYEAEDGGDNNNSSSKEPQRNSVNSAPPPQSSSARKPDNKRPQTDKTDPPARSSSLRKADNNNNKRTPHHDHNYRRAITSWMQHESDTDLYIRSLSESLMIHKEIVERIENEKEQYVEKVGLERKQEREQAAKVERELKQEREKIDKMEREYKEERSKTQHQYQVARQALDEQLLEYQKLQVTNHRLASDLENTKQEYKRMEANYYSHVRQIKATDDDLSTVQSEMTSLFSQVNQLCMSLRSKVDREAGTAFAKERWPDKEDVIKGLLKEDEELLDSGYIGLFTEKYIVEVILDILEKPLNPGVSINDAFDQVEAWFAKRNPEWAVRLRQQASALVAKQPADEEETIEDAKQQIVRDVMETLTQVHPKATENPNQEKKIANIISRAAKLSLAIKGQEIPVQVQPIEEGSATFDGEYMKPASRGKSEGTVLLVITPSFIAHDQQDDDEHGMVIPAKVLCI